MTSIPRLELKAALLLANVMPMIMEVFVGEGMAPTMYGKWKPFVRNRVATIQDVLPASQWNYVSTSDNPADVVSRGCDAATFRELPYWFNGPD